MAITKLNKILIIRLSSLGDVLLTTPLIDALKNRYANCEISFIVRQEYKDALSSNENIFRLILYSRDKEKNSGILQQLKEENFDLIIDLQNNFRSHEITKHLGQKALRFNKRRCEKFLLVNFKINRLKYLSPIAERYADAAGISIADIGNLHFSPDGIHTARISTGDNCVGICPGAQHFTKRYPEEYFVRVGEMLIQKGFRVVLLGGQSDIEACNSLCKKIDSSINLCSNNDLFQTAADIRACKAVICNDSGLMHLACACGVPVITIFGSSVKEFGFAPYKNRSVVLENSELKCRPCSHIGRESCPKGHFNCMKAITPERVIEALAVLSVER